MTGGSGKPKEPLFDIRKNDDDMSYYTSSKQIQRVSVGPQVKSFDTSYMDSPNRKKHRPRNSSRSNDTALAITGMNIAVPSENTGGNEPKRQ